MPLTIEEGMVHGEGPSNHLSEEEHLEQRIKWTQREIAGIQKKKKEEEKEGLSNGRRRYFNKEISRLREKLRELIEEAGE